MRFRSFITICLSLFLPALVQAFPDMQASAPKANKNNPMSHWAFQLPQKPKLDGSAHPVDELIKRRLAETELTPSPLAPREILLNRLYHVLTGLRPPVEVREKWLKDPRPQEEWIAALTAETLARPGFGEAWARHWMDLARYADTKGAAITNGEDYPFAYTYRDWLVKSFNADLPYNQFVERQVAADLMDLPPAEEAALGFLTVGRGYQGTRRELVIGDQIDVTTRGVMGLTVACARCHDHKDDPIPTADFYSLYGVFASSDLPEELPVIATPADSPEYRQYLEEKTKRLRAIHEHFKSVKPDYEIPADLSNYKVPEGIKLNQSQGGKYRDLVGKLIQLDATSPAAPPRAMTLREKEKPYNPVIFNRGNPHARGDKVPRAFLSIFREKDEVFTEGSGRLELAKRLTDERNPLTARVWANRVWMHLSGTPLVASPGDFGLQTDRPLQHELLDHLAHFLVDNGWSTKKLITHILTSQTWQRHSLASEENLRLDPENAYFARFTRLRKPLEAWRDTVLQASGSLDRELHGKPVNIEKSPRRSLYGKIRRGYLPTIMTAFDFPGSDEALMKRSETTTPIQALYLMNSPFLIEQAQALVAQAGLAPDAPATGENIAKIFSLALARPVKASEALALTPWLAAAATRQTAGDWEYGYFPENSESFTPLAHFTGSQWQGAPGKLPLPEFGYLNWTAASGHPDTKRDVVLRWTAPEDLSVDLRSEIANRKDSKGNGIRARVLGPKGETLFDENLEAGAQTSVHLDALHLQAGQRLSFVVGSRGNTAFDSFTWAPKLLNSSGKIVADAKADFAGPPLPPLAQLAQTLLVSNEFFFVD